MYVGRAAAADLQAIHRPAAPSEAQVFELRSGSRGVEPDRSGREGCGVDRPHSPRVGMARDLVAPGDGLAAVQVAGRWTSAQMPAHYARGELASKGAVARFHRED